MSKPIPKRSLDWMPKTVWGPMKWRELHCRALSYLPMKGEAEWLDKFVESIPCPKCQKHFEIFVKDNPPFFPDGVTSYRTLDRPAFFRWTVDAHNFVNRALSRPEISYLDALTLYSEQWMAPTEM